MNEQQQEICRYLLRQSYDYGFNLHSLKPIAEKMGLTVEAIYDEDTNSGILWEFGPYGNGYLSFGRESAGVPHETHEIIEHWSNYRG